MLKRLLAVSLVITGVTTAAADDLAGANVLLCAPSYVMHCSSGGECELGPSENYDIPSFVRVDLERELLLTTESHEEDRSSPIQFLTRANGEIYLQGVEAGRAYSLLIVEATGDASIAIASHGETASAFAASTVD